MATYTISLKGDTTENWEASNRVLVKNEVGVERDDNDNVVGIKIGNGVEGWNSLGYVYRQYSETPQRIGTWIDGTPIWRAAIEHDLIADELGEAAYDALYPLINDKVAVAVVLNGRANLSTPDFSAIDTLSCTLEPNGTFVWDASHQSGSGYTKIIGYIEFVTPVGNIQMG